MQVYINDEIIEKIRDTSDIVDLVSDYVELKKSGSSFMGLCPFHSEKTPSFSVSEEKQFFKCFGCGKGGDIFNFVMEKENLDFIDSVKFLAERYNIELARKPVNKEQVKKRKNFYDMNRDAARFFYSNLRQNKKVISYLNNRNIPNNIINRFGLGYSLDSWESLHKYLVKLGYTEKEISENGLIVARDGNNGYYDRFRNRVMFPIIDTRGRVIGFGGRVLDDSMPKYLNSKDSNIFNKGNNLYGINLIRKNKNRDKIILVEGYMDVIALNSNGINYSVASLGTSLTDNQAKLLKRYGKEIYICYDSDEAGIRASLRAIDILVNQDIKPKIIELPEGEDPDDYINKYGKLEFEKNMAKSSNFIDYKIRISKKGYNLNNVEDKIKYTKEVAQIISTLKSPIERDIYIKTMSEKLDISSKAILKEIEENERNNSRKTRFNLNNNDSINNTTIKPKLSAAEKAQKSIIKISLEDREYFEKIQDNLKLEYLSREYKNIYDIIKNGYEESIEIDIENVINNEILSHDEREIVKSLVSLDLKYESRQFEKIISDLIETLEYNYLNDKKDEIIKRIEELDQLNVRSQDEDLEFLNLCVDLTNINKEINLIREK